MVFFIMCFGRYRFFVVRLRGWRRQRFGYDVPPAVTLLA